MDTILEKLEVLIDDIERDESLTKEEILLALNILKSEIEEEAKKEQENSKKRKSVNQQAMANVLNRKKLREAEKSLRESLVWSGNAQIWEDLVKERSRLRKAQQDADEKAKYRKRVILERIRDGVVITGLLSFTSWIIVTLIEMIMGKRK